MAECNKSKNYVQGRLNFSNKSTDNNRQCSPHGVSFRNWMKNSRITVDIIYYLGSLLVSVFFLI